MATAFKHVSTIQATPARILLYHDARAELWSHGPRLYKLSISSTARGVEPTTTVFGPNDGTWSNMSKPVHVLAGDDVAGAHQWILANPPVHEPAAIPVAVPAPPKPAEPQKPPMRANEQAAAAEEEEEEEAEGGGEKAMSADVPPNGARHRCSDQLERQAAAKRLQEQHLRQQQQQQRGGGGGARRPQPPGCALT